MPPLRSVGRRRSLERYIKKSLRQNVVHRPGTQRARQNQIRSVSIKYLCLAGRSKRDLECNSPDSNRQFESRALSRHRGCRGARSPPAVRSRKDDRVIRWWQLVPYRVTHDDYAEDAHSAHYSRDFACKKMNASTFPIMAYGSLSQAPDEVEGGFSGDVALIAHVIAMMRDFIGGTRLPAWS